MLRHLRSPWPWIALATCSLGFVAWRPKRGVVLRRRMAMAGLKLSRICFAILWMSQKKCCRKKKSHKKPAQLKCEQNYNNFVGKKTERRHFDRYFPFSWPPRGGAVEFTYTNVLVKDPIFWAQQMTWVKMTFFVFRTRHPASPSMMSPSMSDNVSRNILPTEGGIRTLDLLKFCLVAVQTGLLNKEIEMFRSFNSCCFLKHLKTICSSIFSCFFHFSPFFDATKNRCQRWGPTSVTE